MPKESASCSTRPAASTCVNMVNKQEVGGRGKLREQWVGGSAGEHHTYKPAQQQQQQAARSSSSCTPACPTTTHPTPTRLLVQQHIPQVAQAAAQCVRRRRLPRAALPDRGQGWGQRAALREVAPLLQLDPHRVRVPELRVGSRR